MTMIRQSFDQDLETLRQDLVHMGQIVQDSITNAVDACSGTYASDEDNGVGAACVMAVDSCSINGAGQSARPSWNSAPAWATGNWTRYAPHAARRWWYP